MSVPIIFVHKGNSHYLKYSLKQARFFNPDTKIYLLGDKSNDNYDFVEHVDILEYLQTASEFAKYYVHMSFNKEQFEQFCFERWFIINDFVEQMGIEEFLCLDSDVLMFCNSSEAHNKYKNYSFTMRGHAGAGFNYFSNRDNLKQFCNYILSYYTQPELLHILKLNWDGFLKRNSGGVCDMLLFSFYKRDNIEKIGDCGNIENNIMFEYCAYDIFLNEEKINYKDGIPYILKKESATWVRLKALHVNVDKDKIYRYYTGGGLYKDRFKDWFRDMRDKYQLRTRLRKLFSR
jgi:hypothetical protein